MLQRVPPDIRILRRANIFFDEKCPPPAFRRPGRGHKTRRARADDDHIPHCRIHKRKVSGGRFGVGSEKGISQSHASNLREAWRPAHPAGRKAARLAIPLPFVTRLAASSGGVATAYRPRLRRRQRYCGGLGGDDGWLSLRIAWGGLAQ